MATRDTARWLEEEFGITEAQFDADYKRAAERLSRLTARQVAEMLDITTRQLRNLVERGCPKHGYGKNAHYVWQEVFPWYCVYKRDLIHPPDPAEARLLYKERYRLQVGRMCGEAEPKTTHTACPKCGAHLD